LLDAVPEVAHCLDPVQSAQVAVVHFGGPDPAGLAPRGFGVLAAPGEGQQALGVLFPSSVFPGRAPNGHYLCTAFLGGACDPGAVDRTDADLIASARSLWCAAFPDRPLANLAAPFARIVRWPAAIPQYGPGHRGSVAAACQALEREWPGATLCGSFVQGISMADSAQSGFDAVARLSARDATPITQREAA
jgi:oxygen-dependent protoporphyrinogen oxidase